MTSLQIKLVVMAVLLVALGLHLWQDQDVKADLEKATAELARVTALKVDLEQQLLRATEDAKVLNSSLKQAEVNRQALVKQYDARLKKLTGDVVKIPTDCKEAIEWSIENSSDFAWPSP